MMSSIHYLEAAHLRSGTDTDLLEFWVREMRNFEDNMDRFPYKVYTWPVTWTSITNVST